jgi:hypothetical protein
MAALRSAAAAFTLFAAGVAAKNRSTHHQESNPLDGKPRRAASGATERQGQQQCGVGRIGAIYTRCGNRATALISASTLSVNYRRFGRFIDRMLVPA